MTAAHQTAPVPACEFAAHEQQLAAARLWASVQRPYFAAALFAMTPVIRAGSGTVSVDRSWRLYIDPCIFAEFSVEQLGTILLHEIGHLLRDHLGRSEGQVIGPSTSLLWNLACDAEINDDLVTDGLPIPHPVLPRHAGLPDNLLAEDYYRNWPRNYNTGEQMDCGSAVHGQARPWDLDDDDPSFARVHAWEADVIRRRIARDVMARAGAVPRGWHRWAEETLRPTVDWKRSLGVAVRRAVASVSGAVDYSYARPSRRASVSPSVVLPALRRPVLQIAVVCDTSASIDDGLLGVVLSEVEGILRAAGVASRNVWVLACDAAVHSAKRVTSARDVQLLGGGGTNMREGIDAALALTPRPEIVVVLTDGETPWGATPPRARVIAGILGSSTRAFPSWLTVVSVPDDVAQ